MYLSMWKCSAFSVRDLLKAEGAAALGGASCLLRSEMEISSSIGSMSSRSPGPSTFLYLEFPANLSVVFLNYATPTSEPYGPSIVGELFKLL